MANGKIALYTAKEAARCALSPGFRYRLHYPLSKSDLIMLVVPLQR